MLVRGTNKEAPGKPDKQALKTGVEGIAKQPKTLQSRLKDGKPSTADAGALRDKVKALTADGRQLPPAVLNAIGALRAPLAKPDRAFGVAPAPTS
jgi:hypothetical protein